MHFMVWWRGGDLTGVVLNGPRLTLRPWHADDAAVVYLAMQDRALHEFLALPNPYTEADARYWVQTRGPSARAAGAALICAVEEGTTGRLVASADLRLPACPTVSTVSTGAEIGYLVYRQGRGNGYAAEAADVLARWAFEHGAPRVVIVRNGRGSQRSEDRSP